MCVWPALTRELTAYHGQYENAAAVMVVFDIGSRESFQACGKWLNSVKASRSGNGSKMIGVMVGNKKDFRSDEDEDSRVEVDFALATRQATDMGLQYFETSAAGNEDVEEPFKFIAQEFYARWVDMHVIHPSNNSESIGTRTRCPGRRIAPRASRAVRCAVEDVSLAAGASSSR